MKAEGPLVSVGMPVYNGERHLRAAVESILGQTFQDLELIISDNASTDGTEGICREFVSRDHRVRYYRNPKNLGAPENVNAVFRRATGRYFKWAAANDECDPRFIEACVEVLDKRQDAVLSYPRTRLIFGDSGATEDYEDRLNLIQERPCERFRALLDRVRLCNALYGLIRASALRTTGLVGKYINGDRVLLGELTLHGKFVEVPHFMFFRRMDPASATTMRTKAQILRTLDPESSSGILFQQWKLYRGYLTAVFRAPLPARERACVVRFLRWNAWQDRGYFAQDFREAGQAWTS